jgi:hypothetical protein
MVDSGERTETGGTVWHVERAEVPLKEPVLLEPDSVPFQQQVHVGQLLHLVDPLETPVWPVAFTGGGNVAWRGQAGTLAQRIPEALDVDQMRARFAALKDAADPPRRSPTDVAVYGLRPMWLDEEGSTGDRSIT